jgi:multiple sugar transport system ATP-binding protein
MARVILEDVSKEFPGGVVAVRGLSLEVADGELLVLLGPSGCGKTTTLRLIAGLERPTRGTIRIGEREVQTLPAERRDVAMVFQHHALYPHLSVSENLAFARKVSGEAGVGRWFRSWFDSRLAERLSVERREIEGRIRDTARRLGIEDLLNRRPTQLSGGQQQRVALGRVMVRRPAALLWDEPLSNLDAPLRVEMRRELKRLHREQGWTSVYVTHDQVEALTLGDRVALLKEGELQQIGAPGEVYVQPKNRFVAGFVGMPPMSFVSGELAVGEGVRFKTDSWTVPLPERFAGLADRPGRRIVLGVRPEAIHPAMGEEGPTRLNVRVTLVEPLGDAVAVECVAASPQSDSIRLTAKWGARCTVNEGHELAVDIDPEGLHVFDADSGDNLGLREIE